MIKAVQGDIVRADAEALVNTVNCVGVMGRGIALQFKNAFPENYAVYRATCERGQLRPGQMLVHDRGPWARPRYIINFPTKRHWRGKSRIEDIDAGLRALVAAVRERQINSVAIPPLGAGLGGLDWRVVRPRIEATFEPMKDVHVLLYEPAGAPAAEEMRPQGERPKMTPGRAVLVGLMHRYLAAVMEPAVTLLEIHKLMYFAQEAGEPLKLRFAKGPYGPYAENLRHVLSRIEGHYVVGYGDAEDRPSKPIELLPGAADAAEWFLTGHPHSLERFDRVASLIKGYETAFGLELLSTVHWVISHQPDLRDDEVVSRVRAWSPRKRMFTETHMGQALKTLQHQGWL
jgi:O-acetyl-ADP-ribose deacetylase (regulator of RNase III)